MRSLITPSAIRLSSIGTEPIRNDGIGRSPARVDFLHRWSFSSRRLNRDVARRRARTAQVTGTA
jgi:hypothetical protein